MYSVISNLKHFNLTVKRKKNLITKRKKKKKTFHNTQS